MNVHVLFNSTSPGNGTYPPEDPNTPLLTNFNVLLASVSLLLNAILSLSLNLRLSTPLLVAALRCFVQLSLLGVILKTVFTSQNPWTVSAMGGALVILGAWEATWNRSKRRFEGMFWSTLLSMGLTCVICASLASRWAMGSTPWWSPERFIPVLGMSLGNAIAGISVGVGYVLNVLGTAEREKVELSLAFGATRWEATRPLLREAIRLATLPSITQMSVMGLISIPGTMTGTILGGADVDQAVKYQLVLIFVISGCTGVATVMAVWACLAVVVDERHRVRPERIYGKAKNGESLWSKWRKSRAAKKAAREEAMNGSGPENTEREPLLSRVN
ncbi:hypothetical protein YB2330_000661 [Saitoella coloradoensis]